MTETVLIFPTQMPERATLLKKNYILGTSGTKPKTLLTSWFFISPPPTYALAGGPLRGLMLRACYLRVHNPTHKSNSNNRRQHGAWIFYASMKLYTQRFSREWRNVFDYVEGNSRTTILCSRNRPDYLHEEMEENEMDEEAT